jgi:phytoene synthase
MTNNDLQAGFIKAKTITKHFAKTFYLASLFLPKEKRLASYSVYSICRLSDEIVDNPDNELFISSLEKLRANIDLAYSNKNLTDGLLRAFQATINKYKIPKEYFLELLNGMHSDITKKRYANFDELNNYCFKAAGVVGLIMLKIFDLKNENAKNFAIDLGIGMQLTNILRDIKEDYLRGRIYIPADEMKLFAIREEDIANEIISDNLINLLKYQIKRAREYYANSNKGIYMISDSRSRFVVTVMKEIYSGILDEIENNHYNIFNKRVHVNRIKKILIIFKIFFRKS